MKLKLKYYKVIAVLALGLFCLVAPFLFLSKVNFTSNRDMVTLVFVALLLIYILISLGRMLFFEFYEVEFTQTTIKLKNSITRKETFIETVIIQFKINPVTGRLSLIDNENDVIVILNAFHYFNVPEALDYLNLRRNSG
ncbi:hypothetical protein [Mucilaginibacter sp.]